MEKVLKLVCLAVLIAACGLERKRYELASERVPCQPFEFAMCLSAKNLGTSEVEHLSQPIEGLTYEWGVVKTVEVRVEPVPNPPADGSSIRLVLERVVETRTVATGTRFTLELEPEHLQGSVAAGFKLLDGTAVLCNQQVCNEIATKVAAGAKFKVEFLHTDSAQTPVQADRVL